MDDQEIEEAKQVLDKVLLARPVMRGIGEVALDALGRLGVGGVGGGHGGPSRGEG